MPPNDKIDSERTPRTTAGRYLLHAIDAQTFTGRTLEAIRDTILAIEAEAEAMGWQDGMARGFMEGEAEAGPNEAAERLRTFVRQMPLSGDLQRMIDAALAAEAAALPERAGLWQVLYDDYDRGTCFITDDPVEEQTAIANGLPYEVARNIADTHNAALAAPTTSHDCDHGMSAHGPDGCIHCDCKVPGFVAKPATTSEGK